MSESLSALLYLVASICFIMSLLCGEEGPWPATGKDLPVLGPRVKR